MALENVNPAGGADMYHASAKDFRSKLENCGISRGDILFVHSSMNWIGGGVSAAVSLVKALTELVGPQGTVCMPSYTWRPPETMQPPAGSVVDLRRTPTAVGLLPEVFRRWNGVLRSASYWVPVCALGAHARDLVADQHHISNPFGSGSTFRRIMEAGGRAVGIGVALNTSSLSHLPDHDLAPLYPIRVFSDQLLGGELIDFDGSRHMVRSMTVRSDLVTRYTPSAMFEQSAKLRAELVFRKWGNAFVFSYPARVYYEEALVLGRECLASGRLPPWLSGRSWMPDGDLTG